MAYCRFSSDNFQCDVYVYEGGGGWTTHVAGNRPLGAIPARPAPTSDNFVEFVAAHRAQLEFLATCARAFITLPHAGESFLDDTPGACADRLLMLRALGYTVPQYAIDELRMEAALDHD
jgi:hypothetical protein